MERIVKRESFLLYKDGHLIEAAMKKGNITETGIYDELQLELHDNSLKKVTEVHLEKTGEISFLKKRSVIIANQK